MASGITLSAGVRQNLLSLQNTASMMASTQNRLATGKKVNSALDNPSNFFTSQTLQDRAGDLNSLLDSIGQATKTLDAANNGITSLTKLVQSAKSIAQQARSATGAVETFSSVSASSNILATDTLGTLGETKGTHTSANASAAKYLEANTINLTGTDLDIAPEVAGTVTSANTALLGNELDPKPIAITGATMTEVIGTTTGSGGALSGGVATGTVVFNATVNGASVTYTATFDNTVQTDQATSLTALRNAVGSDGSTFDDNFNVTASGADDVTIAAATADSSFTINASSTALSLADLGLSTSGINSVTSSSIFDQMKAANPAITSANEDTLTIEGTGPTGVAFATQTITFGNGNGEVSTLAELDAALATAQAATGGAFTGNITAGALDITKTAGARSSVTIGGSIADNESTRAIIEGATAGDVFAKHSSAATLADVGKSLTAGPFDLSAGGSLDFTVNGNAVSVALGANDNIDDIVNKLNAETDLSDHVTITKDTNHIKLVSKDTSEDFTIEANQTSAALGLTTDATTDNEDGVSDSLFNRLKANGAVEGDTLTISGMNADGTTPIATQTITFGNGVNGVKNIDDLNAALTNAAGLSSGGFSASIVGGAINITKPAASKASITVGGSIGSIATNKAALGSTLFGTTNSQKTLKDLDSTNLTNGGSLNFGVNGKNYTVGLAADDRVDDVIAKLNTSAVASDLVFSKTTDNTGHDHIKVDAKSSAVDFTVNANNTSAALGLTTNATASTTTEGTSQSLLDRFSTALGTSAQGKTLTVAANGGKEQTITFGTGTNQVQTLEQLNTKLSELSGVTAEVSDTGALSIQVASGTKENSLTIGGTAAAKLGLTAGETKGTVISTTANQIRTNLQSDFNNVLDQIDALAKDASYNGINLLNGDDLKVTFNENGSSSLTIKGVNFDANNLGMNSVKGDTFQDNSLIDERISAIDGALSTLRSQGSKFGSNLSTVQTRQEFTKNMVNTLQTGGDALVLADTNEEGANLLALQTRQQLSTTALSMSAQQDQAVLRLF